MVSPWGQPSIAAIIGQSITSNTCRSSTQTSTTQSRAAVTLSLEVNALGAIVRVLTRSIGRRSKALCLISEPGRMCLILREHYSGAMHFARRERVVIRLCGLVHSCCNFFSPQKLYLARKRRRDRILFLFVTQRLRLWSMRSGVDP